MKKADLLLLFPCVVFGGFLAFTMPNPRPLPPKPAPPVRRVAVTAHQRGRKMPNVVVTPGGPAVPVPPTTLDVIIAQYPGGAFSISDGNRNNLVPTTVAPFPGNNVIINGFQVYCTGAVSLGGNTYPALSVKLVGATGTLHNNRLQMISGTASCQEAYGQFDTVGGGGGGGGGGNNQQNNTVPPSGIRENIRHYRCRR